MQNQLTYFQLNPDPAEIDEHEKEELLYEMKKEEEEKMKAEGKVEKPKEAKDKEENYYA